MNNYQKVKELLSLNTIKGVGVKDKCGDWKVFTHINGEDKLEGTSEERVIEVCLSEGLSSNEYSEEDMKRTFTNEIIPIPQKPKVLKKGTKVKILDIAKECGDYEEWVEEKEMIGVNLEIKESCDLAEGVYYKVWTKDKYDWFLFSAYCVVPVFETETIKIGQD